MKYVLHCPSCIEKYLSQSVHLCFIVLVQKSIILVADKFKPLYTTESTDIAEFVIAPKSQ